MKAFGKMSGPVYVPGGMADDRYAFPAQDTAFVRRLPAMTPVVARRK